MKRRDALSLLGIAPAVAALPAMARQKESIEKPATCLVEAHRGNSVSAPENTLAAIAQAIEIGADRVEIDLECSLDKKAVVIHDSTLDRTTNGTGKVSATRYADIKKLDAGSWKSAKYTGEHVPLLSEVFEVCKGKTMVNIDLKNLGAVPEMVQTIKDMQMEDYVVMTGQIPAATGQIRGLGINITMFYENSKNFGELIKAGNANAAIKLAVQEARAYQLPGFLFKSDWVTPEIVYHAHCHGLAVNVWDVNTRETAKKMFAAGVDAIMTDIPAMFV